MTKRVAHAQRLAHGTAALAQTVLSFAFTNAVRYFSALRFAHANGFASATSSV